MFWRGKGGQRMLPVPSIPFPHHVPSSSSFCSFLSIRPPLPPSAYTKSYRCKAESTTSIIQSTQPLPFPHLRKPQESTGKVHTADMPITMLAVLLVAAILAVYFNADQETQDQIKGQVLSALHHLYEQRESYKTIAIQHSHAMMEAFLRGFHFARQGVLAVINLALHPSKASWEDTAAMLAELGQHIFNTVKHIFGTAKRTFKVIATLLSVIKPAFVAMAGEAGADAMLLGLLVFAVVVVDAVFAMIKSVVAAVWWPFASVLNLLWNILSGFLKVLLG